MKSLIFTVLAIPLIIGYCSCSFTNDKQKSSSINDVPTTETLDTNFYGMNYYEFNNFLGINFYDTLPNVIAQIKQLKGYSIVNIESIFNSIEIKGKYAGLDTKEIFLYFEDGIFTGAYVNFGFSDARHKYSLLSEALNEKYGKGYEYKKEKMYGWRFKYYTNGKEHKGGFISLMRETLDLELFITTEKQDYYIKRRQEREKAKIKIDKNQM